MSLCGTLGQEKPGAGHWPPRLLLCPQGTHSDSDSEICTHPTLTFWLAAGVTHCPGDATKLNNHKLENFTGNLWLFFFYFRRFFASQIARRFTHIIHTHHIHTAWRNRKSNREESANTSWAISASWIVVKKFQNFNDIPLDFPRFNEKKFQTL